MQKSHFLLAVWQVALSYWNHISSRSISPIFGHKKSVIISRWLIPFTVTDWLNLFSKKYGQMTPPLPHKPHLNSHSLWMPRCFHISYWPGLLKFAHNSPDCGHIWSIMLTKNYEVHEMHFDLKTHFRKRVQQSQRAAQLCTSPWLICQTLKQRNVKLCWAKNLTLRCNSSLMVHYGLYNPLFIQLQKINYFSGLYIDELF